jgi:hypothetical protein
MFTGVVAVPTRPRTARSAGRPEWNTRFALDDDVDTRHTSAARRLHHYNSLLDPALRPFFAKRSNRVTLLHAGFVSTDGVIVANPEEKIKRAAEAEARAAAEHQEQHMQVHHALTARAVQTHRSDVIASRHEHWESEYRRARERRQRLRAADQSQLFNAPPLNINDSSKHMWNGLHAAGNPAMNVLRSGTADRSAVAARPMSARAPAAPRPWFGRQK